jgi:hypothetical protein
MTKMMSIAFDIPKKLNALSILSQKGEGEALRVYPELKQFIISCRGKSYLQVKQELLA